MKKQLRFFLFAFLFLSGTGTLRLQGVKISSQGGIPDSSAVLELHSLNKGFLLPRLTMAQRDSIVGPAQGLIVLNTNTGCLNMYFGSGWRQACFNCGFPDPSISVSGNPCAGDTLQFTASPLPGASYAWIGPNGFAANTPSISLQGISASDTGWYQVSTTLNNCTSNPAFYHLVFDTLPVLSLSPALDTILSGTSTSFQVGLNMQNATVHWTPILGSSIVGALPQTGLSFQQVLQNNGLNASTLMLLVQAQNSSGCWGASDTARVFIPSGNGGSGNDGSVVVSSNKNLNIDIIAGGRTCADGISYALSALNDTSATLQSTPAAGCLAQGDEILLINVQGTQANHSNVGNKEFLRVQSISNNVVVFTTSKSHFYGDGALNDLNIGSTATHQRVLLQRVPNYGKVTINAGATLTAEAWNGTTGGILCFRSNDTIFVNGAIDMNAKGYRSAAVFNTNSEDIRGYSAYQAGVSGHGEDAFGTVQFATANWGGRTGGGAYGTAGDIGNPPGGTGAAAYGSSTLANWFMGSPGGSTYQAYSTVVNRGGNGGGIIALFSKTLLINGEIRSNGGNGVSTQYSATGGGAGGTVLLRSSALNTGSQLAKATGGIKGPNYGYQNWQAADGSVGRIAIYYSQSLSGNTLPAAYVQQLP
jgi:hypothetical protein